MSTLGIIISVIGLGIGAILHDEFGANNEKERD